MRSMSFARPNDTPIGPLPLAAGFLFAYLLLDQVSFIHPLQEFNITPWNPQPALAIALIALYGKGWIAWVFVTVFTAEFVVRGLSVPIQAALPLTAILTCGYAGVAWLLRAPFEIALDLASRKDVLRLAIAVVLGAGVTGFVYVSALSTGGYIGWEEYTDALFRFWVGDSIGILVTLPLLLLLADRDRRRELWALARKGEARLQIALVVTTLLLVFATGENEQFKYFYLLFLPLIWIAARHGLVGAIVAVAVIQAGIIVAVVVEDHQTLTVIELQTLLLSLVLTGLFLGVTVDEWRFASERLARARHLTVAGEMATALAHELNQPLTALSTYADAIRLIARSDKAEQAPLADTAERIRRVATRCADIVERFRSLGSACTHPAERVALPVLLQAAIDGLNEQVLRVGAEIELDVADDLPPLALDRGRITIVFQNLLANALDELQACPAEARHIRIHARRDGRAHVSISVRDSGPGIRPELLDRIFEPFYSGKAQGMGLGLAISRSIIESHGGKLRAEPGPHGIFQIRLPL